MEVRSDPAHGALVIPGIRRVLENLFITDAAAGQACIDSHIVNFAYVPLTSENQTGGPCSRSHLPCQTNLCSAEVKRAWLQAMIILGLMIYELWFNACAWVTQILSLCIFYSQKHLTCTLKLWWAVGEKSTRMTCVPVNVLMEECVIMLIINGYNVNVHS